MRLRLVATLFAAALIAAAVLPASSQAADDAKPAAKEGGDGKNDELKLPPFPADKTVHQSAQIAGKALNYDATVGSLPVLDEKGKTIADVMFVAYTVAGANRPVTFALNGGPGASSVYLNLGAIGPKRVQFGADGNSPSDPATPLDNAGSWLDFTDLVFIDPVGTGYSRFEASGGEVRKKFFSIDGDVESIALTIRRWLEKSGRLRSPKFVAGESYGGIRGPKIVRNLQIKQGVGVRGLILISPLLDFREFDGSSLLQYVGSLPTMAAVAREAKGDVSRSDMANVEHYAQGDFLVDLVRGLADTEATIRLSDKVAALTGIDPAVSRRLAGRFSVAEFRREFDRKNGKVTGRYDASVSGFDPYPDSSFYHFKDPSGEPLAAPLTSAAVDLLTRKLNWRPDGSYQLLSSAVEKAWNFGDGINPPESISQLREILALDPKLRLLIGHGLFDLATPYFSSQIELNQLPAFASPRVKLVVYPGGHMFYSRDAARQAFRAEVEAMMK